MTDSQQFAWGTYGEVVGENLGKTVNSPSGSGIAPDSPPIPQSVGRQLKWYGEGSGK